VQCNVLRGRKCGMTPGIKYRMTCRKDGMRGGARPLCNASARLPKTRSVPRRQVIAVE
jgi:hypothetical protein